MSEEYSSRAKHQVRPVAAEPSFSMHEFKQSDTFRSLRDIQCNFDDLDFKEAAEENDQDGDSAEKLKFDFESDKG